MKKYETINEIIKFIQNKHREINSQKSGVYGYKLLRKYDGTRIPIEEIKGFKIFRFQVFDETTLTIDSLATGLLFRGNEKTTVSSRLFLPDLALINVYDHRAEFFSTSSIDFAYIENTHETAIQMLSEYVNNEAGIIRAQWVAKNENIDRILEDLKIYKTIQPSNEKPRFINLGLSS